MYPSYQENSKYAPYPPPSANIPPMLHYPSSYASSGIHLHHPAAATTHQWSTGLCHCFDDPANAFITCFCPCITFGQIAEIVNQGSTSCSASGAIYGLLLLTFMPCLYSCFYRSRLRGQYDLEEGPCVDCLVHFFCEFCALCQEHRELKNHGFDMGIGWQANMDRRSRGITVAPTVGGMIR